ncbi:hypothetical protein L2E82_39890 [Cichorium intybus]|uniref:Uncharacterized protein n=1 Tax=Cichorium intybus TaxID=13427 RepID=A0ACB9AK45_CICIN|nr:hypothetical protein L2E82_39890 [Cichorium intybus]
MNPHLLTPTSTKDRSNYLCDEISLFIRSESNRSLLQQFRFVIIWNRERDVDVISSSNFEGVADLEVV